MSQTTEFNYVYRTMKMVEHMGSLQGFEYGPDGEPTYMIGPPSGPLLDGPVMVLPTTTGFKTPAEDEIKVIAAILEEEVRDLLPPGSYAWERVAERVREKLQQRNHHVRNRAGRVEGKEDPRHEQYVSGRRAGKTEVNKAAQEALDKAKREVEERKAEVKPEYTPNCFACGLARFFANMPARGSGHGTACQYYEPAPDRPTVEEAPPEPVDVEPREAGKSEKKTSLDLAYEKDLKLARRALSSAKTLKLASPGLADLMRELGDALEHHAKQAPEHYKEVEEENLRLQNSLLKMVEVLRNRDKTHLWKTIRFGRILRKLGYLPELDA